ncbi:putative Organic solvent tolerance protein OstA [Candidatus Sulfotelmatomonas gaucii]|uniref:Putative Organic solvent tolerance protein OstA n=1 Tax=Candidatus Sulfuritelmatomonas gaucii TaxID=2043161 RepID=A0A2N9LCH6_9BACT|nr:putative Organic solvent tolerance protein OstA [Candidatus Sulfotelmatomonas gaucii]
MRPRYLVFITLLAVCHLQLGAQTLTNAAPAAQRETNGAAESPATPDQDTLPDDPGQELVPVAVPEPAPSRATPLKVEAQQQKWVSNTVTLTGEVVFYYQDYVIRADKVVYNRETTELEADGHLQVTGGPNDVFIKATQGNMRLNMHTARFYNVTGSQGIRTVGHTVVYSTPTPLLFSGRVLLQTGEGNYKVIDGSMTNCRLPHPDWRIIAHTISMDDRNASTSNAFFEFLGLPVFYLPYLHHPTNATGRVSGLLTPVISNGSSIKGYTFGEQVYWAISRSMDAVVGTEYYSKRGWAPNGDFRYKGPGLDHVIARWNALLDRGVEEPTTNAQTGQVTNQLVNQGGVDVSVLGRKDLSPKTRVAGSAEYLSSYVYRLVFDDNYAQAISSEVSSEIVMTHNRSGMIPSVWLDRFQSFANTTNGNEVKILRLPLLRYDVLDRPLGSSPLYWGLRSSLGYLNRSEPLFHSRNVGRLDFYPHLSMPINAGGWSIVPEAALRDTAYTISQVPTLTGPLQVPTISHDPIDRKDIEAAIDIRPPALERDFELPRWHRELRHVIEPELNYRYVTGIGTQARNVLLFDTTDIATNVNEGGFALTQRFYVQPTDEKPCSDDDADAENDEATTKNCPAPPREWVSWRIAQEYFIDPNFGGALIPGRRNVFDATLDLMAPTFLTSPRNIAPIDSRIRFEAIDNLRVEWDLDYDTIAGNFAANNLFAGYSFGRTTLGIGHALLNAPDETVSSGASSTIKSQQLQPFLEIGKSSGNGFNLAMNGGYDFVEHQLQYGGVQAVYNWNCCGLTVGYRRFELGTIGSTSRDETQWLYSFTLANFGAVGDIRRANSVFRDPTLPPAY